MISKVVYVLAPLEAKNNIGPNQLNENNKQGTQFSLEVMARIMVLSVYTHTNKHNCATHVFLTAWAS